MANLGVVQSIQGTVKAIAADGTERLLRAGDQVFSGERIVTGPNGVIGINLANGSLMTLGQNSTETLDDSLLSVGDDLLEGSKAAAHGGQAGAGADVNAAKQDVDAIQQALLDGTDPSKQMEATAAGGAPGAGGGVAGGGNEGGEPVVRLYLIPEGSIDAGFDTNGPNLTFESTPIQFNPVLPTTLEPLTIQIFAFMSNGAGGFNRITGPVPEGITVYYAALALDAQGIAHLDVAGTVDIAFAQNTAISGLDYAATNITVSLGEFFTAEVFDDYFADNGELYNVTVGNFSNAASYSSVTYIGATTIIDDNSNIIPPEAPPEGSDNPYGPEDTVTIRLYAVVSESGAGVISYNGLLLAPVNSVAEGTNATYIAYAVDPNGNIIGDATGNVTITFGIDSNPDTPDAKANDYASTSPASLGVPFTSLTTPDPFVEPDENFTVSVSNYTNAAAYENVAYGPAVTTTIIDNDASPTIGTSTLSVSEEGLTGGNRDGDGNPEDTTNFTTFTGTIGISGNNSAPLTAELSLIGLDDLGYKSGNSLITWNYGGDNHAIIVGTIAGPEDTTENIIRITLNGGSTAVEMSSATPPTSLNYTVELLGPVDHLDGLAEDILSFDVGVSLSDGANPVDSGTITVTVEDDGPLINLASVADGDIALITQDAQTIGTATDTASASFAAAFLAAVTPTYGADGAGTTAVSGYTLNVTDSSSGLTSNGLAITLAKVDSDIVGSTTAGDVFKISVDASGNVTLTQYAELDHLPEDVDATNDNTQIALPGSKVTLSATATVTDGDNDTATAPVSIDLGGNIRFDDDVPSITVANDGNGDGVVTVSAPNTASSYTDLHLVDWNHGADGYQSYSLTNTSGGTAVINTQFDGQVVIDLKYESTVVGKLTLYADGTDSLQVFSRPTVLVTDELLTSDVTASGPALVKNINSSISGLNITVTGSDGNATPNQSTDQVNPSTQGWAVSDQQVDRNESIKFSFSQKVDTFSFRTTGFTGSPGLVGLQVVVWYANNTAETFYVNSAENGTVKVHELSGFGAGDGTTAFTSVEVISNTTSGLGIDVQDRNDGFRLNNVTVGQYLEIAPDDLDYKFTLNATDGDGDTTTQAFNVTLSGNSGGTLQVEGITGTAGDDTLNGTSENDILIGGAGDDTLIGGLGNNTLTGGDGADTFKWASNDAVDGKADTITDFDMTEGDVLDLHDLLSSSSSTLSFEQVNSDTVLTITDTGPAAVEQTITFAGTNLFTQGGVDNSDALVQAMIDDQSLLG